MLGDEMVLSKGIVTLLSHIKVGQISKREITMKKLNIEPLADYVFLSFEKEVKTKSGIILSDVSKSKPCLAKVIAVGPGKIDRNGNYIVTKLKPGDTVIVDPFTPQPIKIDGEEIWVTREQDIFARKTK